MTTETPDPQTEGGVTPLAGLQSVDAGTSVRSPSDRHETAQEAPKGEAKGATSFDSDQQPNTPHGDQGGKDQHRKNDSITTPLSPQPGNDGAETNGERVDQAGKRKPPEWKQIGEAAVAISAVVGVLLLAWGSFMTRESIDLARQSNEQSGKDVERSLEIAHRSLQSTERASKALEAALEETRKSSTALGVALGIFTQQLERTDRPYLNVEVVSDGPVIVGGKPLASPYRTRAMPAGGTTFIFKIVVSNDGRSPTTSAAAETKVLVEPVPYGALKTVAADECRTADLMRSIGSFAFTVRPFETLSINDSGCTLDDGEILSKPKLFEGLEPHFYAPVLVGCIAYRIPYSNRTHFTQFVLDIRRNAPPGFFEFGVPVPQQEVVFRPRHGFATEQN